jgi:hypothetical protein
MPDAPADNMLMSGIYPGPHGPTNHAKISAVKAHEK